MQGGSEVGRRWALGLWVQVKGHAACQAAMIIQPLGCLCGICRSKCQANQSRWYRNCFVLVSTAAMSASVGRFIFCVRQLVWSYLLSLHLYGLVVYYSGVGESMWVSGMLSSVLAAADGLRLWRKRASAIGGWDCVCGGVGDVSLN